MEDWMSDIDTNSKFLNEQLSGSSPSKSDSASIYERNKKALMKENQTLQDQHIQDWEVVDFDIESILSENISESSVESYDLCLPGSEAENSRVCVDPTVNKKSDLNSNIELERQKEDLLNSISQEISKEASEIPVCSVDEETGYDHYETTTSDAKSTKSEDSEDARRFNDSENSEEYEIMRVNTRHRGKSQPLVIIQPKLKLVHNLVFERFVLGCIFFIVVTTTMINFSIHKIISKSLDSPFIPIYVEDLIDYDD